MSWQQTVIVALVLILAASVVLNVILGGLVRAKLAGAPMPHWVERIIARLG
jgi:hypothetical protein